MSWRDKYKGKRREDPAMVEMQGRLKNSLVQFSQTDRNKTILRADELDGVGVRHNLIKQGPDGSPSGRTLFHLGPGAQRITFDNVRFTGSGFDSLVSGTDAEHLFVNGCSMETGGAPPAPRRTIFLPPSVSLVPSREEQRRSGKLIGRNEPCPCGAAGKKYKHCHGKIT